MENVYSDLKLEHDAVVQTDVALYSTHFYTGDVCKPIAYLQSHALVLALVWNVY